MQVLREISAQSADSTSATSQAIVKLADLAAALRKSIAGFRLPGGTDTSGMHRTLSQSATSAAPSAGAAGSGFSGGTARAASPSSSTAATLAAGATPGSGATTQLPAAGQGAPGSAGTASVISNPKVKVIVVAPDVGAGGNHSPTHRMTELATPNAAYSRARGRRGARRGPRRAGSARGTAAEPRGLLERCRHELQQVQGVLRVLEIYGAALLAEEMEQVARYLISLGSRAQESG